MSLIYARNILYRREAFVVIKKKKTKKKIFVKYGIREKYIFSGNKIFCPHTKKITTKIKKI